MTCGNCFKCCTILNVLNGIHLIDGIELTVKNGVCSHLINGKCSIYEKRPRQCRDFPLNENSKNLFEFKLIEKECRLLKQ